MSTYEEKILAEMNCESLDDIFSSSALDPTEDYLFILNSPWIDEEIKIEFVSEMVKRGKESVILDNLSKININENWKYASYIRKYKEMFVENIDEVFKNEEKISESTLMAMTRTFGFKKIIEDNWEGFAEKTDFNQFRRKDLINILRKTDIVNNNLSKFLYGNYRYGNFLYEEISEGNFNKQEVIKVIIQNPTRMLDENKNFDNYTGLSDYMKLLEMHDGLLDNSQNLESMTKARNEIEDFISENFELLLQNSLVKDLKTGKESYSVEFLKKIKKFNNQEHKIDKKLAENYGKISENIKDSDIIDFFNIYSDIDSVPKERDIQTIMSKAFSDITNDDNILISISQITKELLEDQNMSVDEMEILGKGHYSKSIKIGDLIFKIGTERVSEEIPYNKRIIQPLIRQQIKGDDSNSVFVEVQNLVDKDWYKDLTEKEIKQDLYKIYSELRDQGIKWTDVKADNVGRLIKPNSAKYKINGQELLPFENAVGFEGKRDNDELGVGELVIIDTDYIFDEKNVKSTAISSWHEEFEEKYQEEQADIASKNNKPEVLKSAIEISKTEVTGKDIEKMSDSVLNYQKEENLEQKKSLEGREEI